ncbi:MAG TPA: serine protease [Alphaproteobacteria bacterium]|jgi:S1-C subfamily serine protease
MRSSHLTLLVIALLVAVGALGQWGEFKRETPRYEPERPREPPRRPRPDEPRPDGLRPLAPPVATDPTIEISVPLEAKSSTGTGFSLDGRGLWMTARHVADGCSRIFVLTGPRVGYLTRSIYIHPTADVAILRTDRGAPHIAFAREEPRVNQTAYHYGYPHGEPGAVQSMLIGRATMRARGRYNTNEPVLVWAERQRIPEGDESLGGISGGPVFDTTGHVIGTTVAGSVRRGRVFTTDMSSLREALRRANVTPAAESSALVPRLTTANWTLEGQVMRSKLTVAKIVCLVDQPTVRPRNSYGRSSL